MNEACSGLGLDYLQILRCHHRQFGDVIGAETLESGGTFLSFSSLEVH